MPTPLSTFLQRQLDSIGLRPDEFAKLAQMTRSHVYFILNGERRNVRSDTLDKIAAALSMTPAEMAVAMGKAGPGDDPDETEVLALFRRVPVDKRPAATDMLRGLAVQPTRPTTNRRQDVEANRQRAALRKLEHGTDQGEDHGASSPLTPWLRRASDLVQGLTAQLAPALAR